MKRCIYICETPFHIMSAIVIICNAHKNDINDIVMSSRIKGVHNIKKNLKAINHINETIIYTDSPSTNFFGNVQKYICSLDNCCDMEKLQHSYDYLYCRNFTSLLSEKIFRYYAKTDLNLKVKIFDEGYSSYTSEFWDSRNSISKMHKLYNFFAENKGKYNICNYITEALFFNTDLVKISLPFKINQMPIDFSNQSYLKMIINSIFDYKKELNDEYYGKIVFFEECFSFDYGNNADLEILQAVSEQFGKSNIVVKRHPRSPKDRFSELGYKVIKDDVIPWEVYMMNMDKPVILLAYTSGALVNFRFLIKDYSGSKSFLLYNLFEKGYEHIKNVEIREWFENYRDIYPDKVHIPETIEGLRALLDDGTI